MSSEIGKRFDFYPATTQEKKNEHTSVRQTIKAVAEKIEASVPDGREKSLAITKLEEAMFWANAGIARNNTGEADDHS